MFCLQMVHSAHGGFIHYIIYYMADSSRVCLRILVGFIGAPRMGLAPLSFVNAHLATIAITQAWHGGAAWSLGAAARRRPWQTRHPARDAVGFVFGGRACHCGGRSGPGLPRRFVAESADVDVEHDPGGVGPLGVALLPPFEGVFGGPGSCPEGWRLRVRGELLAPYRVRCQSANWPYDAALQRLHLDVVRSCKRGVGGPVKALGLPLLRLVDLDLSSDDPWVAGGPLGPACAIIAGSWFLTREVELATTRAKLVFLETNSDGDPVVKWFLPASKTDVEARGVARAHGCCCAPSSPASCPYHAVEAQLTRLRRLFPDRWSASGPDDDLPLFPSTDGSPVTKDKLVQTIVEAARRLGVPRATPDHSARTVVTL